MLFTLYKHSIEYENVMSNILRVLLITALERIGPRHGTSSVNSSVLTIITVEADISGWHAIYTYYHFSVIISDDFL